MKNTNLWSLLDYSKTPVDIEIDIEDLKEFSLELYHFAKILQDNFNKEDLTNFYYNVSYLNIILTNKIFSWKNDVLGFYEPVSNTLTYQNKSALANLIMFHELFHMAGTYLTPDVIYSGFWVSGLNKLKKESIGNCLNEGYTQLLAERYYHSETPENSEYKPLANSYLVSMYVSGSIEQIVGREKMSKFYLNANLKGLINELEKYATLVEIQKFLIDSDNLNKLYFGYGSILKSKKFKQCFKDVNYFCIKAYMQKLELDLIQGNIDLKTMEKLMADYIFSGINEVIYFNKTQEFFGVNDLKNCLDEAWQEGFLARKLSK